MINPSNLLYGVALFLIGQIAVWYQTNGQFLSQWVKEHPFVISLLGVPISYIYIYGSYHLVKAFEGEIWPQRLIGFAIGMLVFSVLTVIHFNQGITSKTALTLALAIAIVVIQTIWK
jgi:hypothetical protein